MLDQPIPAKHRDEALRLLQDAGFDADLQIVMQCTVRTIIWALGGAKANRRKTVHELIELAMEAA